MNTQCLHFIHKYDDDDYMIITVTSLAPASVNNIETQWRFELNSVFSSRTIVFIKSLSLAKPVRK